MRVLAIDPGFGRCGVAVLDGDGTKTHIIYSSCVITDTGEDFSLRLYSVGKAIEKLIDEHAPELIAIEELYFSNNQKTVFHVAEVRGMLMYIAVSRKIPLVEYNPSAIKIALTGYGRAAKNEVMKMVERLTDLTTKPANDDEYDAIALAVTALAESRSRALKSRAS